MLTLNACSEPRTPLSDWKSDCVGRMQLDLPENADIAANSVKTIAALYQGGSQYRKVEFADGQVAGWSEFVYQGSLQISHALTSDDAQLLMSSAKEESERSRKYTVKQGKTPEGEFLEYEFLKVLPHVGVANRINARYSVSLFLDSHWLNQEGFKRGTWVEAKPHFNTLIEGISPRRFGDVPVAPGVCLPYFFIRDDNQPTRHISVTYRLKAHPDITIWLEDANAVGHADWHRKDVNILDPEYRSNEFWTQIRQREQSVKSLWSLPTYRHNHMAGQKGLETFVSIIHKDCSEDFGYYSIAPGDAQSKDDKPDLQLYVIRDARNAKSRGIEPLPKDEFLKMAQAIAASVKRRPTTPN